MSVIERDSSLEAPRVLTKEEDDRLYNQGCSDLVNGRPDTEAAHHYVAYWQEQYRLEQQQRVGVVVVEALAE